MHIIGVSGIQSAVAFKRARWPGLNEREYRISQGHDSAAALIVDGVCAAAAAEERFNRKKHTGDFPVQAISYCLAEAGISLGQIDEVVHGFDYTPYERIFSLDPGNAELYREVYSREALLTLVQRYLPGFPPERVRQVNHHLAHAASAYHTSGWDECLVVVMDGMGEVHSTSVYHGRAGRLELLHQISAGNSIGILYSLVTLHLGFDFNSDEYKIMGLAPYGAPERFRSFFNRTVVLEKGGSIRIPLLHLDREKKDRERYALARQCLDQTLIKMRHPQEEIRDEHRDVAAALQECLDRTVLHVCRHFGASTGLRRLALAGGVTLNCTTNGNLLKSALFEEIYVQPAAGDDGVALGAAACRAIELGAPRNGRLPAPFLGPAYSPNEIERALNQLQDRIDVVRFRSLEDTCAAAAKFIAEGRVIAWYRGRMEFGPRALGHRSILADPGDPGMRDRLNFMVKMREAFRPFAPAVSIEQVHSWFEVPPMTELPYMTITVNVRESYRSALPAITHVNGSARVQTVSAKDNKDFHVLLKAVGEVRGREMVLNTSFNVKGQPIVNTPQEALDTFLNTGIDFLFLENNLVMRQQNGKNTNGT